MAATPPDSQGESEPLAPVPAAAADYRSLFEDAPFGLFRSTPGGRLLLANPAMARLFGYPSAAEMVATVTDVARDLYADPRRRDELRAMVAVTGVVSGFEIEIQRRDGSRGLVVVSGRMVSGPDGRPLFYEGLVEDLTERRRAQDRLHLVLERVTDAFVALDRDWRYTYVNAKAAAIFGRRAEDLIGKHIWTEFPEGVGQPFHRAYERALATQQPTTIEEFYEPYQRWFENRIFPSPEGLTIFFSDVTERKRAELAVREQEARLRLAAHAGNVGLWDWDLETNRVVYSPEWKRQIGYDDHEVSNDFEEWRRRVHPEDLPRALDTVKRYLENPRPDFEQEFRFRHKDGSYRWILARGDVVTGPDGRPRRMLGCHIDLTERKRAEEEIRRSAAELKHAREHLELAQANARIGSWELDAASGGGYWSAEMYRLFDREPAAGPPAFEEFLERIHPDDRAAIPSTVQEEGSVVFRTHPAYGSPRHLEGRFRVIVRDGRRLLFGTTQDVTERVQLLADERRARQTAEASQALLRLLIDGLGPSMFVGLLTPEGVILEANRPALEAAGLSLADVVGKRVDQTYWFSYSEGIQDRLRAAIARGAAGEATRYDERIRATAGRLITIDFSIQPLLDEAGRVRYLIPSAREISDRVRAEEELRRSQTMAALGTVVAGVAHEVRNPLFAMSATLDALEERLSGSRLPHVGVLRQELDRLTRLTTDLVDYGRPARLDLQEVAADELLSAALRDCGRLAEARGVRLVGGAAPGLPSFRADRGRLIQVLSNLIENAVHHAPADSLVSVDVHPARDQDRHWIEFRIEDAGPGFAPEVLARVFEPFFSRRRGGTGLGLSIALRLVEMHGGTITAGNRPEGGAALTVRLPVELPRTAA
jgi:PAS domain S-box-containing protein